MKISYRLVERLLAVLVIGGCLTGPKALAQDSALAPSQTLFTNVNVFDGVQNTLFKADVLVVDNRIETVSREPLAAIQSSSMRVIDGGGAP